MREKPVWGIALIVVTIIAQVVVLVGMTWQRADILATGRKISCRTVPVDPRDLFRGDYVVLRYLFSNYSTIPEQEVAAGRGGWYNQFFSDNNGRFVYVTLVPEPEIFPKWRQDESETQRKLDELIAKDKESPRRDANGQPFEPWDVRQERRNLANIQLRLRDTREEFWTAQRVSFTPPTSGVFIRGRIRQYGDIDYGIEAYYVQEGSGREIENAIGRGRQQSNQDTTTLMIVDLAIAANGEAALRNVRIEK